MQHFSTGDGPGIRSTVFFQGCNLHCRWCHNPETIPRHPVLLFYRQRCAGCGLCLRACQNQVHSFQEGHMLKRENCRLCGRCASICPADALKVSGRQKTVDEVFNFLAEDLDFYKESGGGVTLSGGEPLLQADFCAAVADKCKEHAISVILDTAGNVDYSEIKKVLPYTDQFYFDLKGATEKDYKEKTGGSLSLTVQNMTRLVEDGADVTARIPIIPGYNDSAEYCRQLADVLKPTGIKIVNLLPFHRLGSSKYEALGLEYRYRGCIPPSKEKMQELSAAFSSFFTKIEW